MHNQRPFNPIHKNIVRKVFELIQVFAKLICLGSKTQTYSKIRQNALCKKRQYNVCANALAGLLLTVVLHGVRGGGGDADGDHGAVAHAPRLGNRGRGAAIAQRRRQNRGELLTTLDFTLGALTCSLSAPWPHLKLEQTAEVWPNSQSGEQELNVNCRAGAMRRGCGVWVAQANCTKEHPDWTRPVSSLQYYML